MKKLFLLLILPLFAFNSFAQKSMINNDDWPVSFFLEAELGATGIQYHVLRIGPAGSSTEFNFVTQGGQDILYPFQRYNAGLVIADQHKISFLYQPLELVTEVTFRGDVVVDGVTFPDGTPMEISYGFPFYRITYGFDFFPEDDIDLGVGAALQMRNASIVFKALDGTKMTVSQNLGPVPAVHLFGRYSFDGGLYLLTDITGLWASSAIINGATFSFEGSILDASLRAGWTLENNVDLFINLRFIGGTASGTSQYADKNWTDSNSSTTANYLATTSISFGATLK